MTILITGLVVVLAMVEGELMRYVAFMRSHGYYAEGFSSIGIGLVQEIAALAPTGLGRFIRG